MSAAKTRICEKGSRPRVLVVGASPDGFTVWIRESFVASLLTAVGAEYAFGGMSEPGRGTPEVSRITMARLAEIDPDHLFVYGDLRNWKADPAFMRLRAFQAGRIAEVDRNLWSRGRGPIAAGLIIDQAVAVLADGETAMPRPASPLPR